MRFGTGRFRVSFKQAGGLALGQVLSLLITGTGICSQLLASKYGVSVPTTQSLLNYVMISFYSIYWVWGLIRTPTQNTRQDLPSRPFMRSRGWIYFLLSIVDVEANYFVVKAYQYTSITSVMLLDCFTIPCVLLLSAVFLKAKYTRRHLGAVVLCLAGLITLVVSDYFYNPREESKNAVLGDILCLAGAMLYAISNVAEEGLVKKYGRSEWLSCIGIGGTVISLLQLIILERKELETLQWSTPVALLFIGFGVCLFSLYSLAPYMMVLCSATLLNLSLLTSDVFAIAVGVFLFDTTPSFLYFIAFLVIISGVIFFNIEIHKEEEKPYEQLSLSEATMELD